jgi:hypothetical protein
MNFSGGPTPPEIYLRGIWVGRRNNGLPVPPRIIGLLFARGDTRPFLPAFPCQPFFFPPPRGIPKRQVGVAGPLGGVRVTIGRLKIDTRLEVWRTWARPKVVHP